MGNQSLEYWSYLLPFHWWDLHILGSLMKLALTDKFVLRILVVALVSHSVNIFVTKLKGKVPYKFNVGKGKQDLNAYHSLFKLRNETKRCRLKLTNRYKHFLSTYIYHYCKSIPLFHLAFHRTNLSLTETLLVVNWQALLLRICSALSDLQLKKQEQELLWSLLSTPTTLTFLSCFSAPCGQIWACEDTFW